jgi:hypothetical protein
MAANTNAQAIAFANNYVRPAANDIVSCYLTMLRMQQVWTQQILGNVIPNDANFIQDGATVASGTPDGRAPITDAQVQTMISNLATLLAAFTANSNIILNQMLQIQVTAQSQVP